MLITNIILFLTSCIILVLSGSYLVKSLSKIAGFLRMSEFVIGFIIMAFSTSIPELFIGITSALNENSALSLGNVIGANIADLTLVIGMGVVLAKGIKIKSRATEKDSLVMLFLAALPIVLMVIGGSLSRIDGVILVGVFVYYILRMIKQRKEFSKEIQDPTKRWEIVLYMFVFIISLVLLFLSAKYAVKYATELAIELFFPPILIGLFLLALGTTLPELVFTVKAVTSKHTEIALGDIIGSVVVNSTLVLGITAMIYPIKADFLLFFTSAMFMILVAFLFITFIESSRKLTWKEGISMILLYSFFIMIEFYIKTLQG
jgi:cation:H+ antiporter